MYLNYSLSGSVARGYPWIHWIPPLDLPLHVMQILHTQQNGTQQSVLLSMQEVHGRLLDILALLLSRGVNPLVKDVDGNTPSDKASVVTTREESFLDGAILLGTCIY